MFWCMYLFGLAHSTSYFHVVLVGGVESVVFSHIWDFFFTFAFTSWKVSKTNNFPTYFVPNLLWRRTCHQERNQQRSLNIYMQIHTDTRTHTHTKKENTHRRVRIILRVWRGLKFESLGAVESLGLGWHGLAPLHSAHHARCERLSYRHTI